METTLWRLNTEKLFVILPIEWIKRNNLKEEDIVELIEQDDKLIVRKKEDF